MLQMDTVARQVCMAAGSDMIRGGNGADQNQNISREYFAPDAVDSVYREIVRSLHIKKTGQTMDVFSVEFDVHRRQGGWRMQTGGAAAGALASALRMQNAALSRPACVAECVGVAHAECGARALGQRVG